MTDGSESGEWVRLGVCDARRSVAYLLAPESDEYIAVMEVLESSVTDLTPAEVSEALARAGSAIDGRAVEKRLDQLVAWDAVSARTDAKLIRTRAELLSRNWRYTATPAGRQVQRFYRTVLAGAATMREIPLASLARVVDGLERLRDEPELTGGDIAELISRLFTGHDDLDSALVGAEDMLSGLADRFDLDDDRTAELKGLLVDYATRVAAELERGAGRAHAALTVLRPRYPALAETAVAMSDARSLIEAGALTASRGGRAADWEGLRAWFDPGTGRAARFAMRLVRALPAMHVNLRRLHTSSGTATGRARALAFARACADPELGTSVFLAALGDHSWRKLHGTADEEDATRLPSWRTGPLVPVPELLHKTGRAGPRGRPPAARDDAAARERVAAARAARRQDHDAALRAVLAATPGAPLSEPAARVALAALMATVRSRPRKGRRSSTFDGLGCTLLYTGVGAGIVRAPTWRVVVPGRRIVFHLPGEQPVAATAPEPPTDLRLTIEGVA
jgi:uncharacterized protein (TIGR02677 family)